MWDEVVGQSEAVSVLQSAVCDSAGSRSGAMTHAWLITGPPGSGRFNLAYAFVAALLSGNVEINDSTSTQVRARSHPDLVLLSTEGIIIKLDDIRETVRRSYFAPSIARYRVVLVEEADRMQENASNFLLKSLEEPPAETVWILCAPSWADVLPTIRSRVRSVRLRTPSVTVVADLLVSREGIDPTIAEQSARHSQSNISMACRLATSSEARRRREVTLRAALDIRDVADAVLTATFLVDWVSEDAKALGYKRDEQEKENLMRSFGIAAGGTIPPVLRSQLRVLEEERKRRVKRGVTDGIDRIFTDLLSLYRDVLMVQLDCTMSLINTELDCEIRALAEDFDSARVLRITEHIHEAWNRIERNVSPQLAIEAMLVSAQR